MNKKYFSFLLTMLMSMAASVASAHDFEMDGIYYNITSSSSPYTVEVAFQGSYYYSYGNEYTGSVTIPESVTYDDITYSVTRIGSEAFCCCNGLTAITIPTSVTSIGGNAFYDCWELTSVTIPNSVTSIGGLAFSGCSGLTSVTIPNSVTSIGSGVFERCTGLETIVVSSGNTVYDSREGCNAIIETSSNTLIMGCKNTIIPNSVTSIGGEAFSGCSGLTSVTIPNSVTSIGRYAFLGCYSLTSISMPNGVTSIGEYTFYNCSRLTSITIPNSVTYIGYSAFANCEKLTHINCRATTPPSCESSSMYNVPEDCTIEVPMCCKAAYEAASPWNKFNIVETEYPGEPARVALAAEYGTFCSVNALDFTDVEGVKAYIASVFDTETGELTLTRVKKVKARTGLVLRGTPGQTYEIPEGTGTTVVANLLVGVTEDTELSPTDGNFTNFIMAKNDVGSIGFFRVSGTSTLKARKAYLQLPSDELSSEVKGFRMLFDDGDMSDNVETIHNEQFTIHNEADAVYDLQGRRVAKPTKGIYIVNGKKTVIR